MSEVKVPKGGLFVEDKSIKQGGKRNLATLADGLKEQAKCHACGCDDCKGYETIVIASTGELAIRYYTGPTGGPYVENVKPFAEGLAIVEGLYAARFLTPTPTPTPTPTA